MNEKIVALLEDEKFVEELKKAESVADVQKLLAANGVEMSVEEIEKFRADMLESVKRQQDGEMDDDQLEQVAGGKVKYRKEYGAAGPFIYILETLASRW